jgi:hypothetical protein
MREGLAATGFDAAVPPAVLTEQAQGIEASHCGLLNTTTAQRMALAQVARDQFMARVVEAHAAQGVLLLAGNGHVRTDIGAPRWLSAATRARSEAIGVLEAGDDSTAYDRRAFTAAQPRPDPCKASHHGVGQRTATAGQGVHSGMTAKHADNQTEDESVQSPKPASSRRTTLLAQYP